MFVFQLGACLFSSFRVKSDQRYYRGQTMRAGLFLSVITAFMASQAMAQDEPELINGYTQSLSLREAAAEAYQREDYENARRFMKAAGALQPGHAGILRGQYFIALRDEDLDAALMALHAMARAGLVFEVDAEQAEALAAHDSDHYTLIAAQLAENATSIGQASIMATIPQTEALIESVAVDIETERLYVGSVATRSIYMIEPFARDDAQVFADASDGLFSVFGMVADRRTRMLYVTTGVVGLTPLEDGEVTDDTETTALLAFDLTTGELYKRYTIPDAGRMADLTVRDGQVYISDTEKPRIYRLDNPDGELEVYLEDPRFASLQGVAFAQGSLWAADYALGVWRIDPVTRQASLTRSLGESLIGLDGLSASRNGVLYGVRNGGRPHAVIRILPDLEGGLSQVEPVLRAHASFMEPTIIRIADERAFMVANSQWPRFSGEGDDGVAPEPTHILSWALNEAID